MTTSHADAARCRASCRRGRVRRLRRAGLSWLALVAWLPGAANADDSVLVEVGRSYFVQYCSSCHGVDARGNGPVAASLRTPPVDLRRIAARRGGHFPAAEIAEKIDGRSEVASHGSREMPVWGRRFGAPVVSGGTSEEVVRGRLLILVEYLRSIQD